MTTRLARTLGLSDEPRPAERCVWSWTLPSCPRRPFARGTCWKAGIGMSSDPSRSTTAGTGQRPPARPRSPLGRAIHRFLNNPSSGRNVLLVIVVANLTTIIIGGLAVWVLDRAEFEHLTEALWYSLQTVTTVGYGDVTPTDPSRPPRRGADHAPGHRLPEHHHGMDHLVLHRRSADGTACSTPMRRRPCAGADWRLDWTP